VVVIRVERKECSASSNVSSKLGLEAAMNNKVISYIQYCGLSPIDTMIHQFGTQAVVPEGGTTPSSTL
jgi:hypothetical protein